MNDSTPPNVDEDSSLRRYVGMALLATMLAAVALAIIDRGPVHSLQCSFAGRDGWTIELPSEPTELEKFKDEIGEQTGHCVDVVVSSRPAEATDIVVEPIGARVWVDSSREILVSTVRS